MPSSVLFLSSRLKEQLRVAKVKKLRAFAMLKDGALQVQVYRVIAANRCESASDPEKAAIEESLMDFLRSKPLTLATGRSELEILLDDDKEYRLCFGDAVA